MNFPKIGVVVLTFNAEKYIKVCVDSLINNNYPNCTIIVVDNNSQDNTCHMLCDLFPGVKLIRNKKNLGYAGGNNIGIKYLLKKENCDYILILNDDTIVNKNIINELLKSLNNNAHNGIAGSVITYFDRPDRIWFAGGYLNKNFCFTRHSCMNKGIDILPDKGIVGFITGACMMIKREVFEVAGFFSEDYFLYWEDVDFCQRATNYGYKCYLVNKPLVKHMVSVSAGNSGKNTLSPIRAYYYARNPFLFMEKNGFPKFSGIMGQMFIRFPYYLFSLENFFAFREYLRGIKDGFRYMLKI